MRNALSAEAADMLSEATNVLGHLCQMGCVRSASPLNKLEDGVWYLTQRLESYMLAMADSLRRGVEPQGLLGTLLGVHAEGMIGVLGMCMRSLVKQLWGEWLR